MTSSSSALRSVDFYPSWERRADPCRRGRFEGGDDLRRRCHENYPTQGHGRQGHLDASLVETKARARIGSEFLPGRSAHGKAGLQLRNLPGADSRHDSDRAGTTQATNCRVFFRAFQAQTPPRPSTPPRPIAKRRSSRTMAGGCPLPGVQTDATGQAEYVTLPFFAVDRINLAGPADLTTQPADMPNGRRSRPLTREGSRYLLRLLARHESADPAVPAICAARRLGQPAWLVQQARLRDPIDQRRVQQGAASMPDRRGRLRRSAIPPSADTSTSDKLAQRNLAYIDGPNPGANASRRMPHPFQIQATPRTAQHVGRIDDRVGRHARRDHRVALSSGRRCRRYSRARRGPLFRSAFDYGRCRTRSRCQSVRSPSCRSRSYGRWRAVDSESAAGIVRGDVTRSWFAR